MGAGIAQVAAQKGFKVTIADVADKALDNGRSIIDKSIKRVARKAHAEDEAAQKKLIDGVFANLATTTDADKAVSEADLVIEAIVENIGVKQKLWKQLDNAAPKGAIFVSNTSSLPIGEIFSVTGREAQTGGLHFFNPVPQMKLVEVIKTDKTSDDTYNSLMEVSKKMGKVPVTCTDTPGFIVNRLLVPYMLEALRLVDRGDASPEDVDIAMKLGSGMPMGPFELSDFVGLDTLKFIADGWRESGRLSAELVDPVKILDEKVAAGKFGRKSGEGFFSYNK